MGRSWGPGTKGREGETENSPGNSGPSPAGSVSPEGAPRGPGTLQAGDLLKAGKVKAGETHNGGLLQVR